LVPLPSLIPAPFPANVLTVTIGEGNLSILVTANVAEVIPALVDDPDDPQAITTSDGFVSVNDDALHFTQEETVNGDEPVGRLGKRGVDMYDPREKVRDTLGYEEELVEE
jgi:hypothetical protein